MEKIIQITAGRGPAECTSVVAQVLKKMLDEAKEFNLKCLVIEREQGVENGTL
jgi:peptide chain release factor